VRPFFRSSLVFLHPRQQFASTTCRLVKNRLPCFDLLSRFQLCQRATLGFVGRSDTNWCQNINNVRRRDFTGDGKIIFSDSAADQFIAWIRKRDAGSAYLLILVRPSGLKAFETLRPQLAISGIPFGFDLVGTDETILDPVRGAVP